MMRYCSLFVVLVLLAGGAFPPPALFAMDYLLFASAIELGPCKIYEIDGEANLRRFRGSYSVGFDSHHINSSPDGKVVLISGKASPSMSVFFIDDGGSITPPVQLDNPPDGYRASNPASFHQTLPLLYAGIYPISVFRYSMSNLAIDPTGWSIDPGVGANRNLGHSAPSNSLVFDGARPKTNYHIIQSIKLNADGSFGSLNSPLTLLTYNNDFAVSPDGRWAAASSLDNPELQFMRIEQDGSVSLAQEFDVGDPPGYQTSLAFTSDSRRLLAMVQRSTVLLHFEIDQEKGELINQHPLEYPPNWSIQPPGALAITPDGRYAAFRSQSEVNLSHDILHFVRIHEDGRLEYLPDKTADLDFHVAELAFVPLPKNAVDGWAMYE